MKLNIFLLKENKDNLLDYTKQEKKRDFFKNLKTEIPIFFDDELTNFKFIEDAGSFDDKEYATKNFFQLNEALIVLYCFLINQRLFPIELVFLIIKFEY